jgi:hypothetical protein
LEKSITFAARLNYKRTKAENEATSYLIEARLTIAKNKQQVIQPGAV